MKRSLERGVSYEVEDRGEEEGLPAVASGIDGADSEPSKEGFGGSSVGNVGRSASLEGSGGGGGGERPFIPGTVHLYIQSRF